MYQIHLDAERLAFSFTNGYGRIFGNMLVAFLERYL